MTPSELKTHPLFGSFAAVSRAIGVSREAVRNWKQIPPQHCRSIERFAADRGHIDLTRYVMRPDVFGGVISSVNVDDDDGRPRQEVQTVEIEATQKRYDRGR